MTAGKENAALVGAGVAACAVCCAGPILGFVAALEAGAVAGTLLFGLAGLVVAAAIGTALVIRGRRRRVSCATTPVVQPITIGSPRPPR